MFSSDIPIPVSDTTNSRLIVSLRWFFKDISSKISPSSTNLMAFPMRFNKTCESLAASPFNTLGILGSIFDLSTTLSLVIKVLHRYNILSMTPSKLKSSWFIVSRPSESLVNSNNSLIISRSEFEATWIASTFSNWFWLNFSSLSKSVNPIIPFKGVRISWLTLAISLVALLLPPTGNGFSSKISCSLELGVHCCETAGTPWKTICSKRPLNSSKLFLRRALFFVFSSSKEYSLSVDSILSSWLSNFLAFKR